MDLSSERSDFANAFLRTGLRCIRQKIFELLVIHELELPTLSFRDPLVK